jgi:KipI family sensor histidine kinase inhibitor
MTIEWRVVPAGDSAWLIELPDRIDPDINTRAIEIARAIDLAALPGVSDVVVGYRSVMVYVDPLAIAPGSMKTTLEAIASQPAPAGVSRGELVEVPVCYDGPHGPDLDDVAAFGGCDRSEVVRLHLAREYRVYVVGFVPGFAYMASVDPRIAAPRRASPRLKVPAGSVAVAAGQTGIYPAETPGGWHLIGRTPVRPYDAARPNPFLFRPGDRVRFRRITDEEYRATTMWGDA